MSRDRLLLKINKLENCSSLSKSTSASVPTSTSFRQMEGLVKLKIALFAQDLDVKSLRQADYAPKLIEEAKRIAETAKRNAVVKAEIATHDAKRMNARS